MWSHNESSGYVAAAADLEFVFRSTVFVVVALAGLAVATATAAWWNTAIALAGVSFAVAELVFSVARLVDRDAQADANRGRWRALALGLAATTMLVLAVTLPEHVAARPGGADRAEETVRGFLSAAVLENDGYFACQYLTPVAQSMVARRAGPGATCLQAFVASQPAFAGVASEDELKALDLHTVVRGDRARVVAQRPRGKPVRFVLRRATRAELDGFRAPQVPWRIARGAAAVL